MEFHFLEKKKPSWLYIIYQVFWTIISAISKYIKIWFTIFFSRWLEMGIEAETFAIFATFSPLLRKFMSGKKFNNKFLKVIFAK